MDEYDELIDFYDSLEGEEFNKEDYNNIPVYYCKQCLSLNILNIPGTENSDFCNNCNSTDIGITDIDTWESLYYDKYKCKYLDK